MVTIFWNRSNPDKRNIKIHWIRIHLNLPTLPFGNNSWKIILAGWNIISWRIFFFLNAIQFCLLKCDNYSSKYFEQYIFLRNKEKKKKKKKFQTFITSNEYLTISLTVLMKLKLLTRTSITLKELLKSNDESSVEMKQFSTSFCRLL